MATGIATLNFGAAPGTNVVSVVVTGETEITTDSFVEAFVMAESTAEHNAYEHMVVPIRLTCGELVAGTGFTINGITDWRLTGTFKIRWVWV